MRPLGTSGHGLVTILSLLLLANSSDAVQSDPPPLPEAPSSTFGYPSVAAARAALRTRPGVVFTTVRGWTIATDGASYTIWSFAPLGYPAYPAVVKRQVVPQGAASEIQMDVLCEATKSACDNLVRTFAEMNGFELPH